MSRRPGPDLDDEETSIFDDASKRQKPDTKKGHDQDAPRPVVHNKSEPIRVISMKTPHDGQADKQALEAKAHVVKLRHISDISGPAIQIPMGNLAPPRDAKQSRLRRARDYVIIGLAVFIVGCLVMIGFWFLARR